MLNKKLHGILSLKLKKLVFYFILIIVLIILIILVLSLTKTAKFKTVDYNNTQGSKFSLLYYSNYYNSKDFTSDSSVVKPGYQYALSGLASKSGLYGSYPLWFGIASTNASSTSTNQIPCSTTTAFTVQITSISKTVPICTASISNIRPSYSGSFSYKDKQYFFLITIVASNSQLTDYKSNKVPTLSAYKPDLIKIIQSIKILK